MSLLCDDDDCYLDKYWWSTWLDDDSIDPVPYRSRIDSVLDDGLLGLLRAAGS